MKHLIHDFRWWLVKQLNVVIWALTPEPERSDLRQIWRAQFDNFKKQDGGVALAEIAAQQAEQAHDLAERQRNVIRWPK